MLTTAHKRCRTSTPRASCLQRSPVCPWWPRGCCCSFHTDTKHS